MTDAGLPVLIGPGDAVMRSPSNREIAARLGLHESLCCDNSPNRHATAYSKATAHPVIASAEPGERWSPVTRTTPSPSEACDR